MRPTLGATLLVLSALLPGCADDDTTSDADGHFVYYDWNISVSQCSNQVCNYDDNHETFSVELECSVNPTLSWDAVNWIHGEQFAPDSKGKERVK